MATSLPSLFERREYRFTALKIARELPNLEQVLPMNRGAMHPQFASAPSPSGVTIVSRHIEAGVHRLSRASYHRIMVHASAATRSYCNQVGRYFVRRAGDIDLVPAGEEGGFEAETPFDTVEIVLQPALMERVAAELGGR